MGDRPPLAAFDACIDMCINACDALAATLQRRSQFRSASFEENEDEPVDQNPR